MEFILSVLSVIFVGLIIFAALTIGLSLLMWFFAIGLVFSLILAAKRWWNRYQFVRHSEASMHQADIIEGSYQDVTDEK